MAEMDKVYSAFLKADAAGDTESAQALADYIRQRTSTAEDMMAGAPTDYTLGETVSKGVKRGFKQMGSALGDVVPAMAGSALGFKDYAKGQMAEAAETQKEIDRQYAPQYKSYKDVHGIGDAGRYALESIAEQIPNIITALIPGVGAEAIAGRMAATTVAKGLASQAAAKGLVGEAAEQFIAQGVKAAAPQIAAKAQMGQNVGVYLGAYAQNTPEVFQNIYDKTGELAPGAAAIFGAGAAALDSVLPSKLLGNLSGPMKVGIVEKVLEKSGMDKGLLRYVVSNALTDAGAEGITEGAQEAISMAAEDFVDKNRHIFDSKDWNRIVESSVKGAVAGGAFGGVGGATEAGRAGAERKQQYNEAIAKRQGQLAERKDKAFESELAGLQGADAQMGLPGVEPSPVASTILPVEEETKKGKKEKPSTQMKMFTDEGKLTPGSEKAATRDEKITANKARAAAQREATDLKEAQKRIKDAFNEIAPKKIDLMQNVIQPTALEQTVAQAQKEGANLGGVAKPAPKAAPAAAPVVAPTVTTAPEVTATAPVQEAAPAPVAEATAEPIAEPTVVQKTAPAAKPPAASSVVTDETLKSFGVGPTALLRKNNILEGKDISKPEDAAEVKQILEAYAENRSAPIREKIETYLARPEFTPVTKEAANVPSSEGSVAGTTEPRTKGTLRLKGVPRTTEGTTAFVSGAVERDVSNAASTDGGTGANERPLGKREKTREAKTKEATSKVGEDTAAFSEAVNQHVDEYLDNRYKSAIRGAGVSEDMAERLLPGVHRETEAHNLLKVPALLNKYLAHRETAEGETVPASRAKAIEQAEAVVREIDKLGIGDAVAFTNAFQRMNDEQRNTTIANINRAGLEKFDATINEFVEEAKAKHAEGDTVVRSFPERKGRGRGYAPKYTGAAFDTTARKLAEAGDVAGLLDHFIASADPVIGHVLRKLKGLNLKATIKIEAVKDGHSGSFDPATNTITLDPKTGMNQHTITHEFIHAAVAHVLDNFSLPLTKQFAKFFAQMQDRLGGAYGAQNLQEFAAELISNPEFQAALKTIKAPRSGNMFQRIMQAIAEFFGFKSNAFDKGLSFISDAIDLSSEVEPSLGAELFLGGSGWASGIADAGKAMPKFTAKAMEDTKNIYSQIKDHGFAKFAFGLLRLDNLNKLYGKELPSIQRLINALEKRTGKQEQQIKLANDKYASYLKVQKAHAAAVTRMGNIAIDARIAEVDLLDPNFKPTLQNKAEYARLQSEFRTLPKPVQDMYASMRKDYDKAFNEYKAFVFRSVTPSLRAKLIAEFEAKNPVVGYVPFMRRGDFWVEYEDPVSGERAASAFESKRERDNFIEKALKGKQYTEYMNLQNIRPNITEIPPTSLIGKVLRDLKSQKASQAQLDSVYQAYLTMFPGQSIMKQMMKSENVRGMENDLVRGYGDVMIRWARKMANSEYTPEIDNALAQMEQEARNSSDTTMQAAAANILSQREFFHNPTYSGLIHGATTLSYFEYIAGNISSALVNLASLPMLVWPMLSGEHGFGATTSAMMAAGKVAMNDWSKGKYSALHAAMMDHAQLKHTTAREILEGRRQSTADFTGVKAKLGEIVSYPFAATEQYNRATTAIAAYELAIKNGMKPDAAIKYAIGVTKDAHTSGLATTAPRWMQHPIGRVFLTFKSFAWNSAFVIARAFHQWAKGETPAIKAAARRQLIGTYAMTMAFAGTKGLPFMGAANMLATMLNGMLGDDDEPFDFNEWQQELVGDVMHKGLFNTITNLEVSNRTGLATDLVFRDDPRGVAEHGYALSAMQQAFGPAGSYAVNAERGIKAMNEGQVMRGVESLLPSYLRNALKGARYMTEGATTLKGDPVDGDISAWNSLMQIVGFAPADLSLTYEKLGVAKAYEREILQTHTKLLNKAEMADRSGDSELMAEVNEDIAKYNPKVPQKLRITPQTRARSIKARKAAEQDMIHGVRFNKNLRSDIQDKFFEDDEE